MDCIQESIETRFKRVFDSQDAIVAFTTLPRFKLMWVGTQANKDAFNSMLIRKMQLNCNQETTNLSDAEPQQRESTGDDDRHAFFDFQDNTLIRGVESECNDY